MQMLGASHTYGIRIWGWRPGICIPTSSSGDSSLGSAAPDQLNWNLRDGTLDSSVFLKHCERGEPPLWELMSGPKSPFSTEPWRWESSSFSTSATTNAQGTASSSLGLMQTTPNCGLPAATASPPRCHHTATVPIIKKRRKQIWKNNTGQIIQFLQQTIARKKERWRKSLET